MKGPKKEKEIRIINPYWSSLGDAGHVPGLDHPATEITFRGDKGPLVKFIYGKEEYKNLVNILSTRLRELK